MEIAKASVGAGVLDLGGVGFGEVTVNGGVEGPAPGSDPTVIKGFTQESSLAIDFSVANCH